MSLELTPTQKKALEDALKNLASPGHTVNEGANSPKLLQDVTDFCRDWPTAKGVLLFLADLPGVPGVLKDALRDAVRVGDVTYGVICHH
jgi:hypothetical protein